MKVKLKYPCYCSQTKNCLRFDDCYFYPRENGMLQVVCKCHNEPVKFISLVGIKNELYTPASAH